MTNQQLLDRLEEMMARLTRMETKLSRLMLAQGVAVQHNPVV